METPRFRFDRALWERFITIAQPYFYPNGTLPAWKGRVFGIEAFVFRFLLLTLVGLILESLVVWIASQGSTPPWEFVSVVSSSWLPVGIAGLGAVTALFVVGRSNSPIREWAIFRSASSNNWILFHLLGFLLLGIVVPTAFLLLIALTLIGNFLFPEFASLVAGGFISRIEGYVDDFRLITAALIALGLSATIFGLERKQIGDRWRPWVILGFLLLLLFSVTGVNIFISFVARFLDNTLADREEGNFWQYLLLYGIVILVAIPILAVYVYAQLKLGRHWREWLTRQFLDRYFSNRAYYKLDSNSANTEIDNPDQRITEDVKSFTETTLSFLLDVLDSVLVLISFTAILYSISRALMLGLIAYAVIGTLFTILVGQRLIGLSFNQLRLEANFRYGMVHVRDNSESIAFYRGEGQEKGQVTGRLVETMRNFDSLIIWRTFIYLYQRYYNNLTRFPPYLLVAPLYFSGTVDFGTISQSFVAFSQILGALSLITNRFREISEFAAGINRLGDLYDLLEHPDRLDQQDSHVNYGTGRTISLNNVTLFTPNSEQVLFRDLNLSIETEQNLLIVGPSGCGKSSLLRAIGGLWDNGAGRIVQPDLDQMLFLPQRPYMLLGTLRDQIIYPQNRSDIPDERLQQILEQVNLPTVIERMGGLDEIKDWTNVLSLGEQQRLVFARVLLTKPKFVILDEATSALDVANEQRLYRLLQELETTYISVGHRMSLLRYHQQVLSLAGETRWQVMSAEEFAALQEDVA